MIIYSIAGFDRVFSMNKLQIFSPYELRLLLCGEQSPSWTREDILKYTVPKYGYNNDRFAIKIIIISKFYSNSHGYQRFVNVLVELDPDERKVSDFIKISVYDIFGVGFCTVYNRLFFTSSWRSS